MSPGYPTNDDDLRRQVEVAYDRCYYPQGIVRQLAAIAAGGDRTAQLATITAPTLVIHGADDPLVRIDGGRDTADRIAGAKLLELEGMGHDIPAGLAAEIADAIADHASDAETKG